ncbi:CGLD27 family protein [Oscillatoriales cyanobacterium LEGE 11467]|uniref:CGLD27 family protein n=1 Tax=Zarconia navalis LEGE 11467 TaxID=1828826 RepID=A0A928VTT5_9CYAN|nr:CGLD27 family protein [Zarconia navalis LEGE 11467]
MNRTYTPICPVPTEQQPIVEYQTLRESCFFRSCTGELRDYLTMLAWFWLPGWLFVGPVVAASFSPEKFPMRFFLGGAAGASFIVFLLVVRLYLGWRYVSDRLSDTTVIYEESGWYDGQCWTKTPEILTRDSLVVSYEIQPILNRLQRTFFWLGITYLSGGLVWGILEMLG